MRVDVLCLCEGVCVSVRVCVCVRAHRFVFADVRTCTFEDTCVNACVHTHAHARMCACMCSSCFIYTYMYHMCAMNQSARIFVEKHFSFNVAHMFKCVFAVHANT